MSFHLCVYQQTVNASSGLTAVNSISDPAMPTVSNKYVLPDGYSALFGYAQGATLNRAVLDSPTLAAPFQPQIRPIVAASAVPTDANTAIFVQDPISLPPLEGISMKVVNGGSEATFAALGVSRQIVPIPAGDIKVIRGTATTTLTAATFGQLTVTWDANLPSSNYAVVNAEVVSATGLAFRLIFTGSSPAQTERPGGMCITAVGNRSSFYFSSRYAFGTWGVFNPAISYPAVEVLASLGDTAQTVYLYVVKLGNQPTPYNNASGSLVYGSSQ